MNNLDKFLVGLADSYEFAKYGERDYGYAKLIHRDRFILIYEIDVSNVLGGYSEKGDFKGFLDRETEILYLDSDYYNKLYDESELEKKLIHNIQNEMDRIVKVKYMEYIKNKQNDFKALGLPKFKEFYAVKENRTTLREELETAYKDNTPLDYFPEFGIEAPIRLNDVLDYIIDEDKYIKRVIKEKLDKEDIRIASNYSGIADVKATQREYIGFRLLKQAKLNDMAKDIANGKDERSHILNKLRSISNFIESNLDIKNVVIGLSYNHNAIEITYPMDHLRRLDLESYYMPVKDRQQFCDMFCGLGWKDREIILDSIQYFKYRGKIIWETNKGE